MRSARLTPVVALALALALAAAPVASAGAALVPAPADSSRSHPVTTDHGRSLPAAPATSDRATASSPATTLADAPGNEPPLAEAGLDRRVVQGASVPLDAAGSRDPDGEIAAYRWSITGPNGSAVAPDCRTCRHTAFDATRVGVYEVTLTVTDDDGATASDTLYVTVTDPDPPSVDVAGPGTATVAETPRYTANVTPGDLPVSRIVWTVDDRVVANRSLTAPDAPTLRLSFPDPGVATVRATAIDTAGRTGADTLQVRVVDPDDGDDEGGGGDGNSTTPPVARLDANRTTVDPGGAVELSGADSSDPDAVGTDPAIREYRWDLDGDGRFDDARGVTTPARFDDATRVRLVVVDNDGQRSEPASVAIDVESPGGDAPDDSDGDGSESGDDTADDGSGTDDSGGEDDTAGEGDGDDGEQTFTRLEILADRFHTTTAEQGEGTFQVAIDLCVGVAGDTDSGPDDPGGEECSWPADGIDSVTLKWEQSESGTWVTETIGDSPGTRLTFYDEADSRVSRSRKVQVTVSGPALEGGSLQDTDRITLCTIPESGGDPANFPAGCDTESENFNQPADIGLDIRGGNGPVTEDTTVRNTGVLENAAEYDETSISWRVETLDITGSGTTFQWTAENGREFAKTYSVFGNGTGRKLVDDDEYYTTYDEEIKEIRVCGEGDSPSEGECANEEERSDDGDNDGSGDGGSGGGSGGCDDPGDFCSPDDDSDDEEHDNTGSGGDPFDNGKL